MKLGAGAANLLVTISLQSSPKYPEWFISPHQALTHNIPPGTQGARKLKPIPKTPRSTDEVVERCSTATAIASCPRCRQCRQ
ncbi:uncharacterized protein BDV14DRAFT_124102 [Aspergillus stella-maris]|uniref:uncharacterized protein n=1 Tax=Aspergillus stella-maris TaxID=1810926 RepID=UPI003CCCB792